MTKELKGDRWTCPNDRNLQLRSKLNAGWSIHTGKKAVKKDPQLTETELIEIQKVLQRSERLEQNERDRVMKLVDRLENMKKNANQAGCNLSPNRCALCGDYFCLLRTAPTQCNSCNMILCNKCCIDTECTIDNDLSSNPSQSRRNSSSNGSMANSLIGSTSTNSKTVYLCRICSEQREFLKKSGAWFLRKFPNYLTDGINTKLKSTSTSNVNQIENSNCSPTDTKQNFFISPLALKRNISVSSSNSSSLRLWKFKENGANAGLDFTDNVSDYSTDNDRNQTSNCECSKIPTTSKDNLNHRSPISPAKNQEIFQFDLNSYHSYKDSEDCQKKIQNHHSSSLNSQAIPPIKNFNTTSDTSINLFNETNLNCLDVDAKSTDTSGENNKSPSLNKSKISSSKISADYDTINSQRSNKVKESNFVSDDDCSSPNMANYNYYSKMLTTMNTNSVNDNGNDRIATSFRGEKSIVDAKDPGCSTGMRNLKNPFRSKNRSISSISDEVFNNSLSASASNLNLEANVDKNRNMTQVKCATAKLSRKNRNEEWCSTRLSIDDDKSCDFLENRSLQRQNIRKLASSCNENAGSSLSVNGNRSKISSKAISNLAKKISNQNSSAIIDSVAGNSSTAVHSVSSLATSLAKLNFR